jgi:exosortase/archaeosortase family protein
VGVPGFAVQIRTNCNAIYEMGLYAAASLAYPAAASQRAMGVLSGIAVLYVVNLVRVLSLIFFGHLLPEFFDAFHVYVWQALFLVVVGGLWLGWVGRVRPVA